MTTISDKDRADAQAMAETLAHTREARDNARAYPETARAQNEGADSVARRWMRPSSALDGADLR